MSRVITTSIPVPHQALYAYLTFIQIFYIVFNAKFVSIDAWKETIRPRGEFRPRQSRQLPRVVDLKGRFLFLVVVKC
jgi:hypothetical protein